MTDQRDLRVWPECDPRRQNLFYKVVDSLFYPYMGQILEKGSKLHKERLDFASNASMGIMSNSKNGFGVDGEAITPPEEMTHSDLFEAPHYMKADVLQEKFQSLLEKKRKEVQENQKRSRRNVSRRRRAIQARVGRRWALIQVFWQISKPTFTHAGYYQLLTVAVQTLNPLVVKHLLGLIERYPSTSIFQKGIVSAILLFICSVVDGIAQERHRFLSFQTGIKIRATAVTSIYHHMLNLSSKGKQQLLTGEMMNLLAVDCQKLFEVCQEAHLMWSCPLSMVIVTVLLLMTMGPSTLVGMVSMFLMVPLVQKVVSRMMVIRRERAVHVDKRVDTTTAMLHAIKFCKLNHYEEKFLKRVHDARNEEMIWVKKELSYIGITMTMTVISPVVASALTFVTYALADGGNVLTGSVTFTTLLLFSALRFPINYVGKFMGKAAQGLEACQRIADFLHRDANPQLYLPNVDSQIDESVGNENDVLLEVSNGTFTIGGEDVKENDGDDGGDDDDEANPRINKEPFVVSGVNFSIKKSETLAVVGPVGCGKSTLLHALIGEVPATEETNIKIHGNDLAYASQSPFILNTTLRANILFGREYEKDLYDKVLEACNLLPDLKQLGPARDLTEIGERGVTLSGGQKARISLARCVYAQPSVALFDDVLSALDASTGKWVFERLFDNSGGKETLLSNSAVVLVTHAAHFLSRVDKILVLVKGQSVFVGEWDELLLSEPKGAEAREVISGLVNSVQERDTDSESDSDLKSAVCAEEGTGVGEEKTHATVMTVEERDFGLSDIKTWLKWFKYAGGFMFLFTTVLFLAIDRGFYVANELWLAAWTSAETEPMTILGITFPAQIEGLSAQIEYVKVYTIILCISFGATALRSQFIIRGGARCSTKLFNDMTSRVMQAPMSYFDTTPMGRILNRLTYDVEILDISLSQSMAVLMIASGWFITGITLQISILPWNTCILIPVVGIYSIYLLYYRKSAVDLQRLDAVSRSPVQANLAEGIHGSSTIKVFGKTDYFERKFKTSLDDNTSAMMNFMAAQRWLGVRFQILGSVVVLFAGLFVVIYNGRMKLDVGLIAMLLIWSYNFTISLSFVSISVSDSEAYLTSVERARVMAELPQESEYKTTAAHKPTAEWPQHGRITFENVCMKYRPNLPLALKGLTFTAEAGQRVGICGRTGAGKSTISVALFRLAELSSGRIILDGCDISKLGLEDVRGRKNGMCIIPQDPVLFSGTLRECLDPWGQSSDKDILGALLEVKVVDAEQRGLVALEDHVDEGGRNFSVGERQLLCLARAVLLKPKVLVLDEATASVDGETDAFIQKMIRNRFKGTTLLTVAHRLNTIMDYDVVLVMDEGKVAEFGSPRELLEKDDGMFTGLVDSTGAENAMALRRMVL